MKKVLLIITIFILMFSSCKLKRNSKNNFRIDNVQDSLISRVFKDTLLVEKEIFKIDTTSTKEFLLPFGYPKVTMIKEKEPVFDKNSIYHTTVSKIREEIKTLSFKDSILNYKPLENLILKSKDSLNPTFYHGNFRNYKIRTFLISKDYIKNKNFKLFFLKTEFKNKTNSTRGTQHLYLLSVNKDTIIDIQNIYFFHRYTHSMKSRCFYIDKNLRITLATYSNIEGEVAIYDFKEFELDEKGYFKSL